MHFAGVFHHAGCVEHLEAHDAAVFTEIRNHPGAERVKTTAFFFTIEFLERDLDVSRPTAARYLGELEKSGLVRKMKLGRANFYINEPLVAILGG